MTEVVRCCWESFSLTDTGRVRKHNEDAFLNRDDIGHWVVADGMGGHDAGDVASQMVVDTLVKIEIGDDLPQFVDRVEDGLLDVNSTLRALAGSDDRIIGTTVAGLAFFENHFFMYWCGDSRIYLYRHGRLIQQTVDHTYAQQLVEEGKISAQDVKNHPEGNIITRAVGAGNNLYIDMDLRPLLAGDLFLVCSDGLDKELDDSEIADFLANSDLSLEARVRAMMDEALRRAGRDNTTIILAQVNAE